MKNLKKIFLKSNYQIKILMNKKIDRLVKINKILKKLKLIKFRVINQRTMRNC